MKKFKCLSYAFLVLAVLLSDVMCAAVAYHYCNMQWWIRYEGYSAPADIAFLLAIPYGIGIVICVVLAWFFYKMHRKTA